MSRKRWTAAAIALTVAIGAVVTATALGAGKRGYPRPKGAALVRVPLTPVFESCRIPNLIHSVPLANPACASPEQISGMLTVGTPDVNGKEAKSVGYAQYSVMAGNPATTADEADVAIDLRITDVRLQGSLADYTGELQLSLESRITDTASGPSENDPGTLRTFFYNAAVPCAATADGSIGSTCALTTTADTLASNTIREGKRTIWEQADHTHVFDGGPDGLAATEDDNLLFEVQSVFVP